MHFNENSQREQAVTAAGHKQYGIVYPKYAQGKSVVKKVSVAPTHGMYYLSTVVFVNTNFMQTNKIKQFLESRSYILASQEPYWIFQLNNSWSVQTSGY
jgi:hypothetical protein